MRTVNISKPLPPSIVSKMGKEVKETSTTSYQEIICDGVKYRCLPDYIEGLNSCRAHVKKDGENYVMNAISDLPTKEKSDYYAFSGEFFSTNVFRNYAQVDIRAAYWNMAKRKSYIQNETYNKFINQKSARNMSLGSWASVKYESNYFNGELISSYTHKKATRPLFFDLASSCFELMGRSVKYSGVSEYPFFVWVDAIFCKRELANDLISIINDLGYGCSNDDIDLIVTNGKSMRLYMGDKVKRFSIPYENKNNIHKLLSIK